MYRSPCILAVLAGIGLGVAGTLYAPPAAARDRVAVGIGLRVAPPPPRFERVPPSRHGYVWAPGCWRWNAHARSYVRVGGGWMVARPGYRYRAPHWVRHGREWRLQRGHWRE